MKWKWAAALLLLPGLGAASTQAAGFGFTIQNATVVNNDANTNGKADVGETFTITGAQFSSYLSSGGAPAVSDADLSRYSTDVNATVASVNGDVVRYTGSFSIKYTGPAYPTGLEIETGAVDLTATFDGAGRAAVSGLFRATPGVPPALQGDVNFQNTDFAPYNDGRFSGVYVPNGGGATGSLTGSLNAGQEGFLASISGATLANNDANSNGVADVGETFSLTAPLSNFWPTSAGHLITLTDSDLSRYSITLNGTVASVAGRTVGYNGTFSITYTGPAYPGGVDIETGAFTLTAQFNEGATASAKLSGTFVAAPGVPAAVASDPNFANSDFAVFNPATFHGTYTPTSPGAATGTVSGSLTGGVVGFSAALANGTVTNGDENHDSNADVGETFTASVPLTAYLAVGAPELLDKDLSRYTVNLAGTVADVTGSVVSYTGTFRITYSGPALTTDIESGTFAISADFASGDGSAILTGALTAAAGAETPTPPFDATDFAPFNDAAFTGYYAPTGTGATGTLRGSLVGGSNVEKIVSRKLGAAIEGSVTAATDTNDNRRAIVASGTTLYVLDPTTGNDAPGWAGGKTLDGKVAGRAAVLGNDVFVGTDAGTLYQFNLITGALVNSGQPGGAGTAIYTAPAPADTNNDGTADTVYVSVSKAGGSSSVVKVAAGALGTAQATFAMAGALTFSSPAVPGTGVVFVGSNAGLYALNATDLTPKNSVTSIFVPTSPFVAGPTVFVGINDGSTFQAINASTGVLGAATDLGSPLQISAFYENRSNLLQAGLADGRIRSFDMAGNPVGYTLPGLFNEENTGGSRSMPVEANNILYRSTEKAQIISGVALNGDNQQVIDLISKAQGAVSATGQQPGSDFILASSPDGYVHTVGVR